MINTKKIISVPKDWGFFKRRIKYRKCLIEVYKKVGFSFPIGMDFFDNSTKKKDELWEKRKNWAVNKFIVHIVIDITTGITAGLLT